MVSKASHYSWPKGAALTGVGSQNVIGIPVDDQARLDCDALEDILAGCLSQCQPVYGVILTIGTTKHGAVDSISQVIAMRERYRDMGLSFLIHADAAWGGYFTSMLVLDPEHTYNRDASDDPLMFVNPHTERELRHLRFANSVTVDPHKSGYIAFPAGGLCYRDGRLRHLLTWTSPVLGSPQEDVSRIGVYGVEGSKPGAPPVAAWMSHEVIGLHKGGYGLILGQVVFNAIRMYAHWATMSIDHPELLVVPFVMLPNIDAERRIVRDLVITRTSKELSKDPRARMLVQALGPDLAVNAFACNFRIDGKINQDISEANLLNERIYDRLSFSKLTDDLNNCKLILMSSVFVQTEYRDCLTKFKRRLGLVGDADLRVLVNVPMSPKVSEKEVEVSVIRNASTPALHAFQVNTHRLS
ncbi:pyridoxal phosphate-dependent transferase [Amylostereum chailletii]|nr:pyridoxal phosphate-dependent transferase [Amylostereum chailletii]